jgi:choline-sulfatase
MSFFEFDSSTIVVRCMGLSRWLVLVVTLAAGALAATTKTPSLARSPNIILITLDTTRADRMGFLGSKRGLTPNLDSLARQSVVFTRAYAQAPLTPPSHASILTGTYPQFHQINDMQATLEKDLPYLPEIFHKHGYHTAAFVGAIVLEPEAPYVPGFDRGFDTYDAGFHDEGPGEDRFATVQRHGSVVVSHALAWLTKHPKRPFFLWVHLYDAHDPYDPPEPYKTRYAADPYDGGIAYEDAAVGKFLSQLKLRGLYDGSIVAVMADHGESLGAHGEDTHGVFLYDETIRVPLLIKLPGAADGGKKIENRVELVDVAPTILQKSGLEIPAQMQGESLLGVIDTRSGTNSAATVWHDRPAYSQAEYPLDFGWSALRSLRSEKYLYIQAPRRELYVEAEDPQAERNLAASSTAVADTLESQLQALVRNTLGTREIPHPVLDISAEASLGALGYVSGAGNDPKAQVSGGPDPKDRVEVANMVHRAEVLHQNMQFDEAVDLLERTIAKNPTANFYIKLGTWLMQKEDFPRAVTALRKALEIDPRSTGARFLLGKNLMLTHNYEAAIPELENVIDRIPNAIDVHSFLQYAYAQANRPADAIRECRTVLRYIPDDYGSYLILGQSLARTGDPQGGVEALKKAALIEPQDPRPHSELATIYDQTGKKTDAEQQRAEADRLTIEHARRE